MKPIIFLMLSTFSANTLGADNSWMHRDDVVEVRNIYKHINQDIKEANLLHESKSFPQDCSLERIDIWTDGLGNVRKYAAQAGTEDSAMRKEAYYDKQTVRFIFITYGNIHGAKQEYRIYYGPKQQLIYFDVRNLGIDYSTYTLKDLVTRDLLVPRQAFEAPDCDN